ncbi:MAG: HEAT repeat domain-containing protein [Chthonomonadetes bacterium]|nr:HEAT repeat domain-containing protein [Chthonomonadetes bacterium]
MPEKRKNMVYLLNRLSSPDSTERCDAIEELAQYRHPRVLRALKSSLLFDPEDVVRCSAAEQLGYWEKPSVLPFLVAALADRSWLVRGWAAAAIGDMNVIRYRTLHIQRIVEEAFRLETHPFPKLNMGYALYRFGDRGYLDYILSLLSHRSYRIRCAVANTLLEILQENIADTGVIYHAVEQALQTEKTVAARESFRRVLDRLGQSIEYETITDTEC